MQKMELEEAQSLLLADVVPVEGEEVSIDSLPLGRVLARPVTALVDQPPFPRSPVDGYALRAVDSVGATAEMPVILPVEGKLFAGDAPIGEAVRPGTAVRIMTGAPIPAGCDCVIPQEKTDCGEEKVALYRSVEPHQNYCFQGEDFQRGQVLVPEGYVLDPAAIGAAAGGGVERLTVRRRPRVMLIATGEELARPGRSLAPGKIYNSNLYYLQSRLEQLGVEVLSAIQVGDELEEIAAQIKAGAEQADLVLTTGGVSVGQRDLLPRAVALLGAEVLFHGLRLKPGSPALGAKLDGTPVLSLSGNPFAAAVTFELLARALLLVLQGRALPEWKTGRLDTGFPKGGPVRRFIRGRLENGVLTLPRDHSSGAIGSFVGCNCLGVLPAGPGPIPAGIEIPVLLL